MDETEARVIEAAIDLYRMDCTITWHNFLSAVKALLKVSHK